MTILIDAQEERIDNNFIKWENDVRDKEGEKGDEEDRHHVVLHLSIILEH